MTVEEIEIIVTAKVEEALKEFEKMLPAIKEKRQIIEAIENDDDEKSVRGGTRNVRIQKTVF